mgnify:CR=1 FL=1
MQKLKMLACHKFPHQFTSGLSEGPNTRQRPTKDVPSDVDAIFVPSSDLKIRATAR